MSAALQNDPFYKNGYVAYRIYLAIQLHFTSKRYDYFQYNGSVRANEESFLKRNDRYMFAKFARGKTIEETEDMLAAMFIEKGTVWIGDMNTDEAAQVYTNWQKQFQNFSYILSSDIDIIFDTAKAYSDPFKPVEKRVPRVIQLSQQKRIHDVSVHAIDAITPFMDFIDPLIDDPYVWKRYKEKFDKASPFFLRKLNLERAQKIIQQKVGDLP